MILCKWVSLDRYEKSGYLIPHFMAEQIIEETGKKAEICQ